MMAHNTNAKDVKISLSNTRYILVETISIYRRVPIEIFYRAIFAILFIAGVQTPADLVAACSFASYPSQGQTGEKQ